MKDPRYAAWLQIASDLEMLHAFALYCFADLYQEGHLVCRVGYTGPRVDVAESQFALPKRARAWIAEYLSRDGANSRKERRELSMREGGRRVSDLADGSSIERYVRVGSQERHPLSGGLVSPAPDDARAARRRYARPRQALRPRLQKGGP